MTPDIHTFADAAAAAEACAGHILHLLHSALVGNGHATLAISGGSTPKLMFEAMAKAGFDWKLVHLFWVDERAVPPDDEQSNYRMAEEHLIRPARIRNVHRIPAERAPQQAAKTVFGRHPRAFPACRGRVAALRCNPPRHWSRCPYGKSLPGRAFDR